MTHNNVLLLRDPTDDWQLNLIAAGYQPLQLPVLHCASILETEPLLRTHLLNSAHSGIILTSRRAAAICANVCPQGLPPLWKDKPVFVVGKTTSAVVTDRLHHAVSGEHSGNAQNLSDYIISNRNTFDADKPLLFPCGDLKRDTLPQTLERARIPLECLTIYKTEPSPALKDDLDKLHKESGIPKTIVFFSPSGVNSVIPLLRSMDFDFKSGKLVAIGPSTEKQLLKYDIQPFGTSSEPTVDCIVDVLNKIK